VEDDDEDDDVNDSNNCDERDSDDDNFYINISCDAADDEFWELIKFTKLLFTNKIIIIITLGRILVFFICLGN
jgi:hypothetical protein